MVMPAVCTRHGLEQERGGVFLALIGQDHGARRVSWCRVVCRQPWPGAGCWPGLAACRLPVPRAVPVTLQRPPSGLFPGFFTSRWMSSPGRPCSYRRSGTAVARSRQASRGQPYRVRTLCTVEGSGPGATRSAPGPAVSTLAARRSTARAGPASGQGCGAAWTGRTCPLPPGGGSRRPAGPRSYPRRRTARPPRRTGHSSWTTHRARRSGPVSVSGHYGGARGPPGCSA